MQQLASCVCRPSVRRTGGWAPRDGVKGNLRGFFLLALDAELGLYRNCVRTMKWESRLRWRNLGMMLFLASVAVKENRKILFCRRVAAPLSVDKMRLPHPSHLVFEMVGHSALRFFLAGVS
jgi:hypothetical protein